MAWAFTKTLDSGHASFLALLLTTPISALLLYCTVASVRISGSFLEFVQANRPTIQFVAQLLASLFSALQVAVLCHLINYALRRRLASKSMTLDSIMFWFDAMGPKMDWKLPVYLFVPLALFVSSTLVMTAVWAAALTPVSLSTADVANIQIPSWDNVTLVKEYPSEYDRQGPVLRDSKGLFTYSVGVQFLGTLLAGASSATSIDGSTRVHSKMDKSKFSYIGRSYGMGSSVGLMDDDLTVDRLTLGYTYQEVGYMVNTKCIYNETSGFTLSQYDDLQYPASGPLPDSDNGDEYSIYIGHGDDSIVAIGVAHFDSQSEAMDLPVRKYLAFAAGKDNSFLDKVQCEVDFVPTLFNVGVEIGGRNITVTPTNDSKAEDIDPTRRLKGTLLRQFELIANDETNLYVSTVGSAFNSSITDQRMYLEKSGQADAMNESSIVLTGVENAITAMADDMLEAYSAAQLMIGNFSQGTQVQRRRSAIAIGEAKYNYAVFSINAAIILCLLVELIRTRGWKGVPSFDIADVRQLVIAASEGARGLDNMTFGENVKMGKVQVQYPDSGDKRFMIRAGRGILEQRLMDEESLDDDRGGNTVYNLRPRSSEALL